MKQATFETPLEAIVGGRTAKALDRAFGMRTARDALTHFPRRYSNRGDLTPLVGLPIGEHVTVLAQVLDVRERRMQRRNGKILEVSITDGQGTLTLTFFNQAWRSAQLLPGRRGIFSGKVSEYRGRLQLQHPDYQLFDEPGRGGDGGAVDAAAPGAEPPLSAEKSHELNVAAARAFAERPVPIYPATASVPSWTVEHAIGLVLDAVSATPGAFADPIPADIRESAGIFALGPALELIHRPERSADWNGARRSMLFREAFELQLALLERRRRAGRAASTPRPPRDGGLLARFDASLPFELTDGQQQAGERISRELSEPHPMHRLLQGEVGSGKTLVALRAMLQVAESGDGAAEGGGQSALLAPTEVLAAQHHRSVVETLGPELAQLVQPVLLTSKMPAAERRRVLLAVAAGTSRIVIGTHALLGDQVTFFDLGLVVVDEQHRFGVEQREALRQKGHQPHVLAMTATPIPRTVALTAFGDLEVSTLRDLPPGRQGIETFVVAPLERPAWEARAWTRALEEVRAGRQVYVVCPAIAPGSNEEGADAELVEHSDADGQTAETQMASVEATVAELRARPDYRGVRVEALTGAQRPDEKDAVMRDFVSGEVGVLVATTVIEVGVNVPNASMMIVRDADRFGISQLHQLRGRVGRGEHPGLCLLITSAAPGSVARERVEAIAANSDGFALAEVDLELRREGDILGTVQSGGRSTLRLLRVAEHGELIERTRRVAGELLDRDPELDTAPGLRRMIERELDSGAFDNLAKS